MNIFSAILTILGLCLFEIISSVDNAVVNAEILGTMSKKGQRWFLLWGLLFAVVVIRGILPWMIVWLSTPGLGPIQALTATFSNDLRVRMAIESSSPMLLAGGGTFLIFLFFHWLFLETKNFGLRSEQFFQKQGIWFYAVVSVILAIIVWFAEKINPIMAFGAVVGSSAFFITHGFKQNAEYQEKNLVRGNKSHLTDLSKILYLEVIDGIFSIDSVLGAFAFTLSVPLIIIGNGLGALVLRQLTVGNIERIKKYVYLKNGAMYSIFALGIIMVADAFGYAIPEWISPIATFVIIGYFFWRSTLSLKRT